MIDCTVKSSDTTTDFKHSMIISGSGYVTPTTGYTTKEYSYQHICFCTPEQSCATSQEYVEYKHYEINGEILFEEEPLPKYKVPKSLSLSAFRTEKQKHQFMNKIQFSRRISTQRNAVKNWKTHNSKTKFVKESL